jgi:hypothetical protein
MGPKRRKVIVSALLAGVAALLVAPPAEARRETPPTTGPPSYVPSYDDPSEDFSFESPFEDPSEGSENDETLAGILTDPGVEDQGDGGTGRPTPDVTPTTAPVVLAQLGNPPGAEDRSRGGVLSNTGAETLPLVRAGLAALALGGGLVVLGRRRRAGAASA